MKAIRIDINGKAMKYFANEEKAFEFIKGLSCDGKVIYDHAGNTTEELYIPEEVGVRTSYLVNRESNPLFRELGFESERDLTMKIEVSYIEIL